VVVNIAAFVVIVVWVDGSGESHFRNAHEGIGLAIFIASFLQPVLGVMTERLIRRGIHFLLNLFCDSLLFPITDKRQKAISGTKGVRIAALDIRVVHPIAGGDKQLYRILYAVREPDDHRVLLHHDLLHYSAVCVP